MGGAKNHQGGGKKNRHRNEKAEIMAWLTPKVNAMYMDLKNLAENKQWRPFGTLISRAWAKDHKNIKTSHFLANSHHCIDVWNNIQAIRAGGCNSAEQIKAFKQAAVPPASGALIPFEKMVSKYTSGNPNNKKGKQRAEKVKILSWLIPKLTKNDVMFMDLRSMFENKQWKPFGELITKAWANEHGTEDKTCHLLMFSHHCIDVWNKVKDVPAGGSNIITKLDGCEGNQADRILENVNFSEEIAVKQDIKEEDVKKDIKEDVKKDIKEEDVKKDIKEEDVKQDIKEEDVKQDIKEAAVKVEELSTSDLLACSVCGDICHRAVLTRCCESSACRACAIKKITMSRSCWVENCRTVGVATEDVNNDDVMRQAVDQYKSKGQVEQALLEELRWRMDKKCKEI